MAWNIMSWNKFAEWAFEDARDHENSLYLFCDPVISFGKAGGRQVTDIRRLYIITWQRVASNKVLILMDGDRTHLYHVVLTPYMTLADFKEKLFFYLGCDSFGRYVAVDAASWKSALPNELGKEFRLTPETNMEEVPLQDFVNYIAAYAVDDGFIDFYGNDGNIYQVVGVSIYGSSVVACCPEMGAKEERTFAMLAARLTKHETLKEGVWLAEKFRDFLANANISRVCVAPAMARKITGGNTLNLLKTVSKSEFKQDLEQRFQMDRTAKCLIWNILDYAEEMAAMGKDQAAVLHFLESMFNDVADIRLTKEELAQIDFGNHKN